MLTTREEIESLAPAWRSLVAGTPAESFSSPDWYLASLDAFHPPALAVVVARQGGTLQGVLPFGRIRTSLKDLYIPRVAPFARGDYQPPIVDPSLLSETLPAMLDAGRAHLGNRHGFWWPNLLEGSEALEVVRDYCRVRKMPWIEDAELAPQLAFEGRSFAELERSWSGSHRGDVRRQRRRLEALGPVRVWEPDSVETALPVLREFFEVHDAKWLAQGYPGMFADPANRQHFTAIIARMLGGAAHFSTLQVGESNISFLFGFRAGGWLQVYRPTFRPEFGTYSPSKVHLGLLAERGCAEGWIGIDFLLGDEPYKLQWSNAMATAVTITAGASSATPSFFWYGRLRPLLKARYAGRLARAKAMLQRRMAS